MSDEQKNIIPAFLTLAVGLITLLVTFSEVGSDFYSIIIKTFNNGATISKFEFFGIILTAIACGFNTLIIYNYRKNMSLRFLEESKKRISEIELLKISLLEKINAQAENQNIVVENLFLRLNTRFDSWEKFVTQELIDLAKGTKK